MNCILHPLTNKLQVAVDAIKSNNMAKNSDFKYNDQQLSYHLYLISLIVPLTLNIKYNITLKISHYF